MNSFFNSVASMNAPAIDDYELSVYFTKAQEEIIKNYYDSFSNRKQRGFENSEKRRTDLKELVKEYSTNTQLTTLLGLVNDSKFFKIPDDVFLIVYESVEATIGNCLTTKRRSEEHTSELQSPC